MQKFTTELLGAIDGGIHFPSKVPLRFAECAHNCVQREALANQHNVHVAARRFTAGRHGAIDKRQLDVAREPGETRLQHFGDTESLANQPAQFLEYRAVAVGLKVCLAAFHGTGDDSAGDQLFQVPLDRARPQSERADDLPLVEALVDATEQSAK